MSNTAIQINQSTPNGHTKTLRVAIQGVAGAFHEIAARRYLADLPIQIKPADTFQELVDMLVNGTEVDLAFMAIENTLAGGLASNYALLRDSDVHIIGEVYLRIKQNLLCLPGTDISQLTEVHSHHMAIAQCRQYFRQYPHIRLVETVDTALSARQVAEEQLATTGAIASELAAEMYGLQILAPSIETNKKNHTRFLVLGRGAYQISEQESNNKISLSFAVDHTVGSLHRVLAILAAYQVNLTKIQSMPIVGKPWEYHFYVDFVTEGNVGWTKAIDAIQPIVHDLKIMGVYAQGDKN